MGVSSELGISMVDDLSPPTPLCRVGMDGISKTTILQLKTPFQLLNNFALVLLVRS